MLISGPATRSLPLPPGEPWHAIAPTPVRRKHAAARRPKAMPPSAPIRQALRADEPSRTPLCWSVVALGALVVASMFALLAASAGAL